ncbi:hypothetical protein B5F53_15945 [Blautia sp. An249]|nr:hypothetical protein B5F53_15945 [Blautia sp. An249]
MLLANNIFRVFVIETSEDLKTRNLLSLCNYTGYILLIVVVALVSVLLMRRANMRRSRKYDRYVFGLLIVNVLFSAAAIILSAEFTNLLICLPVTIVCMVIVIILNIKARKVIGKSKKAMRQGDDIYE